MSVEICETPGDRLLQEFQTNLELVEKHPFEKCKRKAIKYLEELVSCIKEANSPEALKPSSDHFSTLLDTAFVLPILQEIPEFNKENLLKMAQFVEKEQRVSGYWNHRGNEIQRGREQEIAYRVLVSDVDDTCKAVMALYKSGILTYEGSRSLVSKMLDDIIFTDENNCSNWIYPKNSDNYDFAKGSLPIQSSVDVDVMANIIYCAGILKLDDDPRLKETLDYVCDTVENLDARFEDFTITLPFHCNKYFLFYLLSRAASGSKVAYEMFGETMLEHLVKEILLINIQVCELEPLAIASLLLAAISLRLHEVEGREKFWWDPDLICNKIWLLSKVLLKQQNTDGFFERKESPVLYLAKDSLYYANDAVITVLALSVVNTVSNELFERYREYPIMK